MVFSNKPAIIDLVSASFMKYSNSGAASVSKPHKAHLGSDIMSDFIQAFFSNVLGCTALEVTNGMMADSSTSLPMKGTILRELELDKSLEVWPLIF